MAIEIQIWLYWLVCLLAAVLLMVTRQKIPGLLSPQLETTEQSGYLRSVLLGWAFTGLAAINYILLTHKETPGTYQLTDLGVFSLVNGTLEQLMFVFWFLLGCWLGKQLNVQSPWKIFGLGFLSYSLYSGAIHALFWVNVLPKHQPALIMPVFLLIMSLGWMWLFWRYRALGSIITMHIMIDFLTLGHLHFPWFESYQFV
ncbi:MAG: hypothetical protein B0A82_00115 [Alkalinema sp. CACIAM 70d]|nr:MAG: hypothetical protein B0A82_00115 [Alkalinema sp. CACIAM 70d]